MFTICLLPVERYYIDKSKFSMFYILRCQVTVPARRHAKSHKITNQCQSLGVEREASIEMAKIYCTGQALHSKNKIVLFQNEIMGPCELTLNFGKYKGVGLKEVKELNPAYLLFLYNQSLKVRDEVTQRMSLYLKHWFYANELTPK